LKCIEKGNTSLEKICNLTGAGTGCGSCKPELLKILDNSIKKEILIQT
jgi:ferredoxin-nitrate reductase